MAFTRKALKAMGLTDEQIDSLIELHTESTDAIKADRDKYKEEAEKLPDVQRQLKEAESKIEAAEKDDYKGKYESEKAAHEKLKGEIATKETAANRLKSFKEEAKKRGYGDEAIRLCRAARRRCAYHRHTENYRQRSLRDRSLPGLWLSCEICGNNSPGDHTRQQRLQYPFSNYH